MKNIDFKFYFNKINDFLSSYVGKLFFLTLVFHIIFIILINYGIINIPSSNSDYINYHNNAIKIADLLRSGNYTFGAVYGTHWYPFFIGIIYIIFIPSILIGTITNAILISFSSVILFKIICFVNKDISKKNVFWISFLTMNASASLMYNSSLLLKDTAIIFLLLSGVYVGLIIFINNKINWFKFGLFLLIFSLLFYLRFFIAYAVLIGFFSYWFTNNNFSWQKRIIKGLIMIVFSGLIVFLINNISISDSFRVKTIGNFSLIQIIKPEFIKGIRSSYFQGGSSTTNIQVVEENVSNGEYNFSLSAIVKSFFNTMFGPFPWQFSLKKYIFIFPDVIVWLVAFFLAIIGILKAKLRMTLFFIVSVGVIIAGLVMGSDNLGALLRYRLPAFVVLAVLSSFGIVELQNLYYKHKTKDYSLILEKK